MSVDPRTAFESERPRGRCLSAANILSFVKLLRPSAERLLPKCDYDWQFLLIVVRHGIVPLHTLGTMHFLVRLLSGEISRLENITFVVHNLYFR